MHINKRVLFGNIGTLPTLPTASADVIASIFFVCDNKFCLRINLHGCHIDTVFHDNSELDKNTKYWGVAETFLPRC